MKGKIFHSILLATICTVLISFGIFVGVLYSYFTGVEETQLKTSLLLAARGVEQSGIDYFDNLHDDCRLTWIDADGTVLFDSEKSAGEMDNHAHREEIQAAFETGEGAVVRRSETLMEKTLYRAIRLSDGTVLRISVRFAGVLLLVLGMLHPIVIILIAALILSLILSSKLTNKIMKPIDEMDVEQLPAAPPYEELQPFLSKIRCQQTEIVRQKKELSDKRLNMEFAEQNRREFTANVSHELKTPLQGIMGSAELIENGWVKEADLPQFGGNIRKEATRLLALIDDIIHLSRLDEGSRMDTVRLDLFAFALDEVQALQPAARQHQVQLTALGEPAMIEAVPQLVREIIHNLCSNAIQYNRVGGKVVVRVTRSESKVVLCVSDSGIGIAKEHQSRIFERFYRVDKSRSKRTNGTGLGLSIVKNAAAYMNADISIESELDVGTTIMVKFQAV